MNRRLPLLLLLVALAVLVAAQQLLSLPGGTSLWRALQDAMHAPWFFVVVMVLCWFFRALPIVRRLLVAGAIGVVLALASEAAQLYQAGRSASVADLIANLVGGVLGFIFSAVLFESEPARPPLRLNWRSAATFVVVALALGAFASRIPLQVLELRADRTAMLPLLADFSDPRSKDYLSTNEDSRYRIGTGTALWPEYEGKPVMRLVYGLHDYPTLYINELMQKWVPYQAVTLDVFVLDERPLPLTVAVRYEGSAGTSAYVENLLQPGANKLRVARKQLVPDAATALKVTDLLVYTTREHAGRVVLVGQISLQP